LLLLPDEEIGEAEVRFRRLKLFQMLFSGQVFGHAQFPVDFASEIRLLPQLHTEIFLQIVQLLVHQRDHDDAYSYG